ncbi:hypothetical protein P168DRAFT_129649 [Aspergillus campestris IBT 28561]|uniref:Uncharacterized protein n=1 Tax=Aspergillus campestris (strain IBT 28561) TaxID=1392248 RepID=A0A2I1D753_ASPC2|nr:uncharacterized protein P168DRAFT_129649 [Aspergillus campestris IBT 28561]PKY05712.1 hypothetical protein P168DRAFT_129649 [Aspergillus campestris IBT 28561]
MPSNKDRLYVALYVRGGAPAMPDKEDTYHWALILGPKKETDGLMGMRFHVKERILPGGQGTEWVFENPPCRLGATSMLLVRIMVGKVKDSQRLTEILRTTPVRGDVGGWNCVSWVKEAVERAQAEEKVLGKCVLDWQTVRAAAMDYCQEKKDQHRFDGQGVFDMSRAPTYDLIQRKESIG